MAKSGRVKSVVKGLAETQFSALSVGKWIHKRCSGVKGSLESCKNFICGKCLNVIASVEMSDSKAEYHYWFGNS